MGSYEYSLDADDVIRFVSDAWLAFGVDNDGEDLSSSEVLGHALWEFIQDAETRHLYRAIFAAVRATGQDISVPFRCDSPDQRRYMRLTVSPKDVGGLELTSELLREDPREPVRVLAQDAPRSSDILSMCGWCKRVRLEGQWVEVEEAVEALGLFDSRVLPRISHGLCDSCRDAVEAAIEVVRTS